MSDTDIHSRKVVDVVVIGGGPAGISAAIWCVELGLSHLVIERANEIGGQLNWTFNPIANYPSSNARDGAEMLSRFRSHAEAIGCMIRTGTSYLSIELSERIIRLSDGSSLGFRSLVIATGVRRRTLGVEGEKDFAGRGIMSSGMRDKHKVADKNVVIIGGGDAAIENAIILSESASRVVVLNRSRHFRARADLVEKAKSIGNVQIIENIRVRKFVGDSVLTRVEAELANSGHFMAIDADLALIRIGVVPNTEEFAGLVDLDRAGYVLVDGLGRTSAPGVYAIGDAANGEQMTLAHAAFSASAAIRDIKARSLDDGSSKR